jgi:hypothetical protein
MLKFITFATKDFLVSRQFLTSLVNELSFDEVISYSEYDLDLDFREKYKNVLSFKRGYGYWIWKPYLILKTLLESKENDIILYIDSTDVPSPSFFNNVFNHFEKSDLFLLKSNNLHDQYTKIDCFILMDCDDEKYHNQYQLEAGIIGVRNTIFNIKLMEEWLRYCSDIYIITDLPNSSGLPNYKGFIDHRHDQSILTNLTIKYDLPTCQLSKQHISLNSTQKYKQIHRYALIMLFKFEYLKNLFFKKVHIFY